MNTFRFFGLLLIVASLSCARPQKNTAERAEIENEGADTLPAMEYVDKRGPEALLLPAFNSLSGLKEVIQIQYFKGIPFSIYSFGRKPEVHVTYRSGSREVTGILKQGINEDDFIRARDGHLWDRFLLVLKSPFSLIHRDDLVGIEILGRRRYLLFGEGDVSFYDIAETMVHNISDDDLVHLSTEDLTDKGYLNTFNHITAQAFMTSIFSETVAEFVADVHERHNMPELITGIFTEQQVADLKDGPVDNYIDMVNNEWGQELGKSLALRYKISRQTHWTPELLANYLNENQSYYSWVFQIGFKPFRATDDIVIRFAHKINSVLKDISELRKIYH